ncbi:hypothetical protein G3480_26085 [Thiorhodococcus mannitoliphagus]|uniref:Uncharacterized protein n=1 Tax=Thiorhodococcus mannitoliphagus TaxID=329406 RepID=A0A6P1DZF9_9GAMM|nr:hypothetical protein [Thiorhodococcus mannitoliphagus]NEX23697.1 hypothetical protein [Thiorhodococcus mannitoliphagus]
MLGEGRNWWNFASSDYHNHWSTNGSDFWPGEYQKNYIYVDTSNRDRLEAIFAGVRSGASWHVEGDLIDKLEFTVQGRGPGKAMMGQTLRVKRGERVKVKIRVHDPVGTNHCPLDMDNPSLEQIGRQVPLNRPVLDHIDLIAGDVTGYVEPPENFESCPDADTRELDTDIDYCKETNESTHVAATFERFSGPFNRSAWAKRHGYLTYVYSFRVEQDMYLRLRGTNLPANVPKETDAEGNPLADSQASAAIYDALPDLTNYLLPGQTPESTSKLDEVAEAYADLWFYSNPIFIDVIND